MLSDIENVDIMLGELNLNSLEREYQTPEMGLLDHMMTLQIAFNLTRRDLHKRME